MSLHYCLNTWAGHCVRYISPYLIVVLVYCPDADEQPACPAYSHKGPTEVIPEFITSGARQRQEDDICLEPLISVTGFDVQVKTHLQVCIAVCGERSIAAHVPQDSYDRVGKNVLLLRVI